jgi:pantothenate synthetase
VEAARQRLQTAPSVTGIDYVTVADAETLAPVDDRATSGQRIALAAIRLGHVRLLDNVLFDQS